MNLPAKDVFSFQLEEFLSVKVLLDPGPNEVGAKMASFFTLYSSNALAHDSTQSKTWAFIVSIIRDNRISITLQTSSQLYASMMYLTITPQINKIPK
jgi:hypothetical protein